MKKAIVGALALIAISAVQASAVTIDFSAAVWDPGPLSDTKTVGQTTIASTPSLPFGVLDQSSNGMGVASILNPGGAVGAFEVLTVSFANPFLISSFNLQELGFLETGFFRFGTSGSWTSIGGTLGGGKTVNLTPALVSSLQFGFDSISLSAFRLKSITGDFTTQPPSTVPEPTSMFLLGTGLLGLAARARRARA